MEALTLSIQEALYYLPPAPPRIRKQRLRVICPGPPRSATESLAQALNKLGYSSYHGWDLILEQDPAYQKAFWHLVRKKYYGAPDGYCHISKDEFDYILGDSDAVIDTVAFIFFPELMEAYPDALVILNTRQDLDAWHQSMIQTFLKDVADSWLIWTLHWFAAGSFWLYEATYGLGFPMFFRSPSPASMRPGLVRNGKWIYREHCAMVRGLVPKNRLLEWSVDDGWEPICKARQRNFPKRALH